MKIVHLSLLLLSCNIIFGQLYINHNLLISDTNQQHILTTPSHDEFIGRTIFIRNDSIGFQIRHLKDTTLFLFHQVARLDINGAAASKKNRRQRARRPSILMPNNQLLYSKTALPYAQKGAYRTIMGFINQVDFQLSKHISVGAGALLPAVFMGRVSLNTSINDFLHFGLTLQHHIILPFLESHTHAYSMATIGTRKKYINITLGYWFSHGDIGFQNSAIRPSIGLGGSYQLGNGWRLYTEALALFNSDIDHILPTFMVSKHSRRNTYEFGVITTPDSFIPIIPILGYTRSF